MSNSPAYLDELRKNLITYGQIQDELTKLNYKKDELRSQLEKWLAINELDSYETFDANNEKLYRLSSTKQSRKTTNVELLQTLVDDDIFDQVVTIKEISVFKCQPVTKRQSNKPSAPSEK